MGGWLIPPPISSPPRASGAASSVCMPQRSASTGIVRNYHIERKGRVAEIHERPDPACVCWRLSGYTTPNAGVIERQHALADDEAAASSAGGLALLMTIHSMSATSPKKAG